MIEDPFNSPRLLLARAGEHIDNLNAKGQEFVERKPYACIYDFNTKTGDYIYKVKLTDRPPPELSLIAADALNNLKSVLDQTLCASVRILSPLKTLDGISFPFADIEAHLDGRIRIGCKKVAPEIVALVRSFKPYKGGNDLLWLMNRISNMNRHRILQPIATGADNKIFINELVSRGKCNFLAPFWDYSKHELIFAVSDNPDLKYNFNVAFHITFGDIDIVRGQPVVPLLRQMCGIVSGIMLGIEAETRRVSSLR